MTAGYKASTFDLSVFLSLRFIFWFLFFSVSTCFYRVVMCSWSAVCTYTTL